MQDISGKPSWISDKTWASFQEAKASRVRRKWVPEVLWEEFKQLLSYFIELETRGSWDFPSDDPDVASLQDLENLWSLLIDKGCEEIWTTVYFGHRKTLHPVVYSRRDDARLGKYHRMISAPGYSLVSGIRRLLAVEEPLTSELMSTKDRKLYGEKIATRAQGLKQALKLSKSDHDVPKALLNSLAFHLRDTFVAYSDDEVSAAENEALEYGENASAFSFAASELFFGDENNILTTLAEAAKRWAETESPVYQASKTRQFTLVRQLTEYFRFNYDDPHPSAVAKIVSALLTDTDMDTQDVKVLTRSQAKKTTK